MNVVNWLRLTDEVERIHRVWSQPENRMIKTFGNSWNKIAWEYCAKTCTYQGPLCTWITQFMFPCRIMTLSGKKAMIYWKLLRQNKEKEEVGEKTKKYYPCYTSDWKLLGNSQFSLYSYSWLLRVLFVHFTYTTLVDERIVIFLKGVDVNRRSQMNVHHESKCITKKPIQFITNSCMLFGGSVQCSSAVQAGGSGDWHFHVK